MATTRESIRAQLPRVCGYLGARAVVAALSAGLVGGAALDAATAGERARGGRADRWIPLHSALLARNEVAAARIGSFIYVVGGVEQGQPTSSSAVERYDIRRNRWQRVRSMPVQINHAAAVAYRGKLYVHGGFRNLDATGPTAALYRYDPARNHWSRLRSSRIGRGAHAAAVIGGRLYVAGGENESGSLRSLEIYDFASGHWHTGPSFAGPARNHVVGVASGGVFYVLGGRSGESALDRRPGQNYASVDAYNPARNRWRQLPPLPRARSGFAAAALPKGRIVAFGGRNWPRTAPGRATIPEVDLLDPRRGSWRSLPPMRTPRHGLGGAALGNRIYALEGELDRGLGFSRALDVLDIR